MNILIFIFLLDFLKISLSENTKIELKDYTIKVEESKLQKDYFTFLLSIYSEKDDTLKFKLKDDEENTIMEIEPFPIQKQNKGYLRFGFMNHWVERKSQKDSLFLYIYERKKLIYKAKIIERE